MQGDNRFKTPPLSMMTLIICALLLWGPALVSANAQWLWPGGVSGAGGGETVFSEATDYYALLMQALQLAAVLAVLARCGAMPALRRAWRWRVTRVDTLLAIGLFAGVAVMADGLFLLVSPGAPGPEAVIAPETGMAPLGQAGDADLAGPAGLLSTLTPAMVAYSLFNAFYEEFFFLFLCRQARPARAALFLSLLLRTAIHTYQGWGTALLIGVGMGSLYWVLYRRRRGNLYAFWLAHAIADMVGLSLLAYWPAG